MHKAAIIPFSNQIRLKQRKITLYHQGKLIWGTEPN